MVASSGTDDVLVDDGPLDDGSRGRPRPRRAARCRDRGAAVDVAARATAPSWSTVAPEMTTPGETAELSASPNRPCEPVDELGRRVGAVVGVDRPLVVVEVEDRVDRRRGPCAPRSRSPSCRRRASSPGRARCAPGIDVVLEVVDVGLAAAPTKSGTMSPPMSCLLPSRVGVAGHRVDQHVGVEDVVAHRRQHLVGGVRQPLGVRGLLAERRGSCARSSPSTSITPNWSASAIGWRIAATVTPAPVSMCWRTIWREVHAVDVVGADDHDDVGLLVVDEVEALEDRVGAARGTSSCRCAAGPAPGRRSCRASSDIRQVLVMCRSRLCDLYWVRTTILR